MKYYIVDAFADELFKGNQAGVCVLSAWPDSGLMQNIAAENNLAETAFVIKRDDHFDLRWFTPEAEMDLCGHATLAAAFVISNFIDKNATDMRFHTKSGLLTVKKVRDLFELDFPARKSRPADITPGIAQAFPFPILEAHSSRDLILLVDSEGYVKNYAPDYELLKQIHGSFAVVLTAKGSDADFVSRFFAPGAGIPEDPVTGSSHCSLIPFWSERLGKAKMVAKQLSRRSGTLFCENCGDRVKISGKAVLYLQGDININIQWADNCTEGYNPCKA